MQEPAVIVQVAKQNPARQIEPKFTIAEFDVGIGMRKDDTSLEDFVNDWVRTNLANGRLDDIFRKFHGIGLSQRILSIKS
ncbi:hypothetical protein [Bradyrhizobium sp. UFLA05-112]